MNIEVTICFMLADFPPDFTFGHLWQELTFQQQLSQKSCIAKKKLNTTSALGWLVEKNVNA